MPIIETVSGYTEFLKVIFSIGLILAIFSVPKVFHRTITKYFSTFNKTSILTMLSLLLVLPLVFGGSIALCISFFLSGVIIFLVYKDEYTEKKRY
jgi:hypothetical protein